MKNFEISTGLLMYRIHTGRLEILLGHPGGPLYENKDLGYWGIPKGGLEPGETLLDGAVREFAEETGITPQYNELIPLGRVLERPRKFVYIWAFPGDCDTSEPVSSNLFEMEWPRHSGIIQSFPELDQVAFFAAVTARKKIEKYQSPFVDRLEQILLDLSTGGRTA
ncbi:MAG TPA: NUDIX domain-containing protein [Methylomusa anaerophila]|uniref:RNA pyrophosphohydrolase n=1 Tax=Methylomusa anaerophila TaxID=1930071 RepID=A0A348AHS9_9FIRM|nr:NUDIX domain-containing protein [Methylomusa anaerophila]BBB90627.1 RNA pyrophosphohydrolase [Methylomusa anaerophila]HML88766.1 NUDIX domain-containing protein [Methylomusa anaerophila]